MTDNATNSGAGDDTLLDLEVADLGEGSENLDLENNDGDLDDSQGAEVVAEEVEEIEHDGKKFTIPKALKPALMFQSDYTVKTQKLAEDRRAWEQERTQQSQASQETLKARATVIAIDSQLDQFAQVDWDALEQQDPAHAARLDRQLRQLEKAKVAAEGAVAEADRNTTLEAQRSHAERLQQGHAELQRDIKDWSPELAGKLADFAQKELGFTADEMSQTTDPRLIKLLHRAYQGTQTATQQAQVARVAQGQKTAPAQQVRGSGGKFTVKADTADFAAFEKMADARLKA